MHKLFVSLVAIGCVAAASAKVGFPRNLEDSQGNLRFSIGDSDYEVSTFEETWETAKYYCKHRGMELLSIETEEEHLAIVEATNTTLPDDVLWMSLNDLFSSNRYVFESTGEQYTYQNFVDGKPNGSPGYSCCMLGAHLEETNVRYWFNTLCSYKYRYVCEKRRETCTTD